MDQMGGQHQLVLPIFCHAVYVLYYVPNVPRIIKNCLLVMEHGYSPVLHFTQLNITSRT